MPENQATPLPWVVVAVSGSDCETFLDGQFTARVSTLPLGGARLAGYCSVKGRLLALFWVLRTTDGLRLALPADGAQAVLNRLKMYVLRSDVVLEPLDQPIYGVNTADCDNGFYLEPVANLGLSLSAEQTCTPQAWSDAAINAGVVVIDARTSDEVIPQMIGLEQLGGLEFKKGCYPGQEIVARLHYKGTLPKKLYRAVLLTDSSGAGPEHGEVLTLDGKAEGMMLGAGSGSAALVLAATRAAGETLTGRSSGCVVQIAADPLYPDAK